MLLLSNPSAKKKGKWRFSFVSDGVSLDPVRMHLFPLILSILPRDFICLFRGLRLGFPQNVSTKSFPALFELTFWQSIELFSKLTTFLTKSHALQT